jgi:hypothetical protein
VNSAGRDDEHLDVVLRFLRGDDSPLDFDGWACSEPTLEVWLGPALYLETISTDYRDREAVSLLKQKLTSFAESEAHDSCRCRWLGESAVLDMGEVKDAGVVGALEPVARRGDPFWWLEMRRCQSCGQGWLIAQEERINDVWIMRRCKEELDAALEDDRWPGDFDKYLTLLRIGRQTGHSVRWVAPIGDSRVRDWLRRILADIRAEEPELSLEEAAPLLGIALGDAIALANLPETAP